jgi:Tfp pilus assembly protein PilP
MTARALSVAGAAAILLSIPGLAAAQGPRPAGRVQVPAVAAPSAPETYSYRPEGRRDPFVSLVNRGNDGKKDKLPPEGLRGLFASDVLLKGILQSRGHFLAIVQGPDTKRPYIVHTNDRLADGVVRAITADSMLILQEVNDPLSLTKQREIRKTLRVVEEVK